MHFIQLQTLPNQIAPQNKSQTLRAVVEISEQADSRNQNGEEVQANCPSANTKQHSPREAILNKKKIQLQKEKKRQYRNKLKQNELKLAELQTSINAQTVSFQQRIDYLEEEQKNLNTESREQINDLLSQIAALQEDNLALQEQNNNLNELLKRSELVLNETQRQLRNEKLSKNQADDEGQEKDDLIESLTEDKAILKEEMQQKDQLFYDQLEENNALKKQLQDILSQKKSQLLNHNIAVENGANLQNTQERHFEKELNGQIIPKFKDEIDDLNSQAEEKDKDSKRLQHQTDSSDNLKSQHKKQIEQLQKKCEDVQESEWKGVRERQDELGNKAETVTELRHKIQILQEQLAEQRESCIYFEQRSVQLMEECSKFDSKMGEREEEFRQQIKKNEEYYLKLLQEKKEEYSDLNRQCDQLNEERFNLKVQIDKLQENADLQNEFKQIQEQNKHLCENIKNLLTEKDNYKTTLNQAEEQIEILKEQLEQLKSEQLQLKQAFDAQTEQLAQKEQEFKDDIQNGFNTKTQSINYNPVNMLEQNPTGNQIESSTNKMGVIQNFQEESSQSLKRNFDEDVNGEDLQRQINEKDIRIQNLEKEVLDLEEQVNMLQSTRQKYQEDLDRQTKQNYQNEYTQISVKLRNSYKKKIKQINESRQRQTNEHKQLIEQEKNAEMKIMKDKVQQQLQKLEEENRGKIQQIREEESAKYNELLAQLQLQREEQINQSKQGKVDIKLELDNQLNNYDLLDFDENQDNNPFGSAIQYSVNNDQQEQFDIDMFEDYDDSSSN